MLATRLIPLALALVAAGCGGGGGATPGAPTAPAAAIPAGALSPTPGPMPDVAGVAVDDTTGGPIAGAIVYVSGATVIAGATPPAAAATSWPSATTAADGSFVVKNVPASAWTASFAYVGAGYPVYDDAQWIEIFPADGHAAFHALRSIGVSGTTALGEVAIALPSAADRAWLSRINSDRATLGVPAVAEPLTFDSITLQTARYWAAQMETGNFFAHACPPAPTSCIAFWLYETLRGSVPSAQNISAAGANGSWQAAEAAFMSESANCPGADWQTCPYTETTGHYINIMQASNWAGVGSAQTAAAPIEQYYAENFSTPSGISNVDGKYARHVP
jgi:hypothetical protein